MFVKNCRYHHDVRTYDDLTDFVFLSVMTGSEFECGVYVIHIYKNIFAPTIHTTWNICRQRYIITLLAQTALQINVVMLSIYP